MLLLQIQQMQILSFSLAQPSSIQFFALIKSLRHCSWMKPRCPLHLQGSLSKFRDSSKQTLHQCVDSCFACVSDRIFFYYLYFNTLMIQESEYAKKLIQCRQDELLENTNLQYLKFSLIFLTLKILSILQQQNMKKQEQKFGFPLAPKIEIKFENDYPLGAIPFPPFCVTYEPNFLVKVQETKSVKIQEDEKLLQPEVLPPKKNERSQPIKNLPQDPDFDPQLYEDVDRDHKRLRKSKCKKNTQSFLLDNIFIFIETQEASQYVAEKIFSGDNEKIETFYGYMKIMKKHKPKDIERSYLAKKFRLIFYVQELAEIRKMNKFDVLNREQFRSALRRFIFYFLRKQSLLYLVPENRQISRFTKAYLKKRRKVMNHVERIAVKAFELSKQK